VATTALNIQDRHRTITTETLADAEHVALELAKLVVGSLNQQSPSPDQPADHDEFHQATGMVMAQMGIDAASAAEVLQAHAWSHDRSLIDTASEDTEGMGAERDGSRPQDETGAQQPPPKPPRPARPRRGAWPSTLIHHRRSGSGMCAAPGRWPVDVWPAKCACCGGQEPRSSFSARRPRLGGLRPTHFSRFTNGPAGQ